MDIHVFANTTPPDPVWSYYAQNLRTGMFTGFLTLSSFLLTMTTFVVMNLKTHYFDSDHYKERFLARRNLKSNRSYYFSLRNLGAVMLATIILAFCTSVSQFTIGLHEARWTVFVCGGLAVATIIALGFNLFQIAANMVTQFSVWEKDRQKAIEAEHPSTHS